MKMDREKYGVIEGVTDREYYTNSFHVPVYFPITAARKIEIEAPYHALTNAGHISYVEMDGDATRNLQAFEKIIRKMKECGIGYGSINHPVDRDPVCGYTGIIGDSCPCCGRREGERIVGVRIPRKTGEDKGGPKGRLGVEDSAESAPQTPYPANAEERLTGENKGVNEERN